MSPYVFCNKISMQVTVASPHRVSKSVAVNVMRKAISGISGYRSSTPVVVFDCKWCGLIIKKITLIILPHKKNNNWKIQTANSTHTRMFRHTQSHTADADATKQFYRVVSGSVIWVLRRVHSGRTELNWTGLQFANCCSQSTSWRWRAWPMMRRVTGSTCLGQLSSRAVNTPLELPFAVAWTIFRNGVLQRNTVSKLSIRPAWTALFPGLPG